MTSEHEYFITPKPQASAGIIVLIHYCFTTKHCDSTVTSFCLNCPQEPLPTVIFQSIYSVSPKIPLQFSDNFFQTVGNF